MVVCVSLCNTYRRSVPYFTLYGKGRIIRRDDMSYSYTDDMDEISGFGGEYEEACRKMVIAGVEWCDAHPNAVLDYKIYSGIYGVTTDETPDTKEMQKVMNDSTGNGCSGAMMQCTMGHVLHIREVGWDKYVEEMKTEKNPVKP